MRGRDVRAPNGGKRLHERSAHEFLQGTCGFAGLLLRAISKVLRLDIEARDVNSFNLNLTMELAA